MIFFLNEAQGEGGGVKICVILKERCYFRGGFLPSQE
jgi:hypothetical protein